MRTWHSKFDASLLQKALYRGVALSFFAALLLLIASLLVPPNALSLLGLPLCLFTFVVIAWGTWHYRKLKKLEHKPHRLVLEENRLDFFLYGSLSWSLPTSSLHSISYITGRNFGVALHLNNGEKMFLPYFSERTFHELQEALLH